jgi:hypothetical protein
MSLAEIEAAADGLSSVEKAELVRYLTSSLQGEGAEATGAHAKIDLFARLQRMFPNGPVKGDAQDVIDYDRGET